ncbi:hypothetical protein [Burkholderia sp. LMG 32019]
MSLRSIVCLLLACLTRISSAGASASAGKVAPAPQRVPILV